MELFEAQVGAQVPPPLDLVEMGLPEDLLTTVVAIEPCPPLQPGNGRVVLTTVNHLNNDVWEITALNAAGRQEQLRPTGFHKFYSETRRDWVSTKEIHDNEVFRGRAGPLTVVATRELPGTERVYNLTVEGEHVYYVSELGLLAHNNCARLDSSSSSNFVYQLVDADGIPIYYGIADGSKRLTERLKDHSLFKAGKFKGMQIIAEGLTRTEAASLETSLNDIAKRSGRMILNNNRSINQPVTPVASTHEPTFTLLPRNRSKK